MTSDRSAAMLRGVSLIGLSALACVCVVVFAVHQSADPRLLRWSWSYLLGAMLPVLGVVVAQAVLVLLPSVSASRDRYLALGCLASGVLVLVLGVEILPLYELPVMAAFLGLMAFPLAGHRAFGTNQWLTSYIALIVVSLVLFVPEAARLVLDGRAAGDHPLPHWGDQATFRSLFPESEPFISAGGRLQPNLDLEVCNDAPGRSPYHLKTNSEGFRNDREIPLAKEPGELRVLNLGDSFSIGFGVDQAQFIGPLLESRWRQEHPEHEITVINAEVSDPAYGLLYLQRYGIGYSPDIVLYGYVDNDSHQAYLPFAARGIFSLDSQGEVHTHPIGLAESQQRSLEAQLQFAQYLYPRASLARIQLGGGLWKRPLEWVARLTESVREFRLTGPAFRWLARALDGEDREGQLTFISTVFETSATAGHLRLIDYATNWGMLYKKGDGMTAPLYSNLLHVFESMRRTASNHGATLVLVYFPRREQVQPQDWRRFQTFWNLDPDDFDLDLEASRLRSFCEAQGIPFIDTTPALRAAAVQHALYLANDTHFNEYGQATAAQAISEFMEGLPVRRLAVRGDGS
jgi:hypothetical protein